MKTALVADNSELIRSMLRDILRENGIKIVGEASTVQEAIGAFKNLNPDLVFLDLIMEDGSGVDVLKSIISFKPKTKVIIITSIAQNLVDRDLLEAGVSVIVHKPFTPGEIQAAIEKTSAKTER